MCLPAAPHSLRPLLTTCPRTQRDLARARAAQERLQDELARERVTAARARAALSGAWKGRLGREVERLGEGARRLQQQEARLTLAADRVRALFAAVARRESQLEARWEALAREQREWRLRMRLRGRGEGGPTAAGAARRLGDSAAAGPGEEAEAAAETGVTLWGAEIRPLSAPDVLGAQRQRSSFRACRHTGSAAQSPQEQARHEAEELAGALQVLPHADVLTHAVRLARERALLLARVREVRACPDHPCRDPRRLHRPSHFHQDARFANREVEAVRSELSRDLEARKAAEEAARGEAEAAQSRADAAEEQVSRLADRVTELQAEVRGLRAAWRSAADAVDTLPPAPAQVDAARSLAEERRKSEEAGVAAAREEAERRVEEAVEALAQEQRRSDADRAREQEATEREAGRLRVQVRQLERQVARSREELEWERGEVRRGHDETIARLRTEVSRLRRERRAALVALREAEGRSGGGGSGVGEVKGVQVDEDRSAASLPQSPRDTATRGEDTAAREEVEGASLAMVPSSAECAQRAASPEPVGAERRGKLRGDEGAETEAGAGTRSGVLSASGDTLPRDRENPSPAQGDTDAPAMAELEELVELASGFLEDEA